MRSQQSIMAHLSRRYPGDVRRTFASVDYDALAEMIRHLFDRPGESPVRMEAREWLVRFSHQHFRRRRSLSPREARRTEGQWLGLAVRYLHPMLLPGAERPLSREGLAEVLSTDTGLIHILLTGSGDEVLRVLSGEFAPSAAEGRGDDPDFGYLEYDAKTYEGWSKDGREALIRALDAEFNPPGQPVLADVLWMLISHSHNSQSMTVTHPYHKRLERLLEASRDDPVKRALVQLVYTDAESALRHIERTARMNRRYLVVSVLTTAMALISAQLDRHSTLMLGLLFGMILFVLYIGTTLETITREWGHMRDRLDYLEALVFEGEEEAR